MPTHRSSAANTHHHSKRDRPVIVNPGCGTRTAKETVNLDWSIYLRIKTNPLLRMLAPIVFKGVRRERYEALTGTPNTYLITSGTGSHPMILSTQFTIHISWNICLGQQHLSF